MEHRTADIHTVEHRTADTYTVKHRTADIHTVGNRTTVEFHNHSYLDVWFRCVSGCVNYTFFFSRVRHYHSYSLMIISSEHF